MLLLGTESAGPKAALPAGARYFADFVTAAEEARLIALLDEAPWLLDLKRRVQHYGYKYDYKKRTLSREDYLGPLPQWALALGERLARHGIFKQLPDQVIVNEYLPGQGIAPHIDRETCFGPTVASLSLAERVTMDFDRGSERAEISLAPRSLISLDDDARYRWRHGIAARKRDIIDGTARERGRRLSLTFRIVR